MLKFCRPSKRKSATLPSSASLDGFAGTSRRRVVTSSGSVDATDEDDDDGGFGRPPRKTTTLVGGFIRRQSARFRKRITPEVVAVVDDEGGGANLLKRYGFRGNWGRSCWTELIYATKDGQIDADGFEVVLDVGDDDDTI